VRHLFIKMFARKPGYFIMEHAVQSAYISFGSFRSWLLRGAIHLIFPNNSLSPVPHNIRLNAYEKQLNASSDSWQDNEDSCCIPPIMSSF
jgi:hypothetical protein